MDFLTGTGVDRASPNCTRSIAIARRGPLAGLVPAESYAEGRSRHRGLDHHLTVRSASPPAPSRKGSGRQRLVARKAPIFACAVSAA
jgi:hypothetical protein